MRWGRTRCWCRAAKRRRRLAISASTKLSLPTSLPPEASLKLPGERSESMAVPPAPVTDRLSMEVAELKKELAGMRHAITRTAYAPAQWIGVSQDLSDASAAFTAAEVSAELAREIVMAAGGRLDPPRLHRRCRPAPTPATPALRPSVGPSRFRQDDSPGQTCSRLRSGRPPARSAALHRYAPRRRRRSATLQIGRAHV